LEKEGVVFSGEVVNLKFSQWHQEFENLTLLPNFE
jgi:hypothetical protein